MKQVCAHLKLPHPNSRGELCLHRRRNTEGPVDFPLPPSHRKQDAAAVDLVCTPEQSTRRFLAYLRDEAVVHPPHVAEAFFGYAERVLGRIEPLFDGLSMHRLHGDCHRGNILDRAEEGLLLIDFDDMMNGPAIQDLWLLLPGRLLDCRQEIEELLERYQRFRTFDRRTIRLIEPLRFMRMVYFLARSALQRHDARFFHDFPE